MNKQKYTKLAQVKTLVPVFFTLVWDSIFLGVPSVGPAGADEQKLTVLKFISCPGAQISVLMVWLYIFNKISSIGQDILIGQ